MKRTATDFSGNGAGNPFGAGGDPAAATAAPAGNAAPQGQTDTAAATAQPDEQMLNSSNPSGGNMTPANPTQASYDVACFDCGDSFTFGRVTANMRCFCGSDNLVYEALTLNDEIEAMDEGFVLSPYPVGPANGLGPAQLRALTPYFEVGHVLTHEEELALGLVSPDSDAAPSHVAVKVSSLGTWVAADFPPKKDDKDKKKDDEDKGGNETHPPVGEPSDGEAPAPAAGTPPEPTQGGTEPPGAVPVDPNAPPAPGAVPGEVVDPLLQVMDTAQQQVDAAVEQANQLGHDAKEVAYDVDQLFSNWRCQNCQIEGEANISDDGQTSLDGDLFANQPCAAPAPPEENQNQEGQVPQQAQQNQLPQGAPATNDQIPATQQGIPSQTSAKRKCHFCESTATHHEQGSQPTCDNCWGRYEAPATKVSAIRYTPECTDCGWRGKTWNDQEWAQHEHDQHKYLPSGKGGCKVNDGNGYHGTKPTLPKTASDGDSDGDDGGLNQRNVFDQQEDPSNNLAKEERITSLVEGILDTNPGMNVQAARRLAEATLVKFPSLAS
jgi:hypothetical protein